MPGYNTCMHTVPVHTVSVRIPSLFAATATILVLCIAMTAGCTGTGAFPQATVNPQSQGYSENQSWRDFPLTDLQGKGSFSISTFAGRPVLVSLESASCPSCILLLTRQLAEIDRVPGVREGRIVSLSLDIDAAEDPFFLKTYGSQTNFTGYSARAPPSLILKVYKTFGPFALDPSTAPVILVCPDRRDILLSPGVKTAETLGAAIHDDC